MTRRCGRDAPFGELKVPRGIVEPAMQQILCRVDQRKFGLVGGIMYMQIATALALTLLAKSSTVSVIAFTYAGFSALQWMSDPGMYTLLMNRVGPAERSGASALNALVIAGFQALAALVAGGSFVRYGYPAVLIGAATVALISAVLFRVLMRESPLKEVPQEAALVSSARP